MPVSQYNILRPKAFDKNAASAQQVIPTSVLPSAANPVGASNLPNGGSGAPTVDPNNIPPEQIAALQAAAAQGDPNAIDLLKMLGIGAAIAGTATGTTMLARAMANRGGKVSAAPLPNAEAASIIPPKGSTAVVPHVNRVYGEHLVPNPPGIDGILPVNPNQTMIGPAGPPVVTREMMKEVTGPARFYPPTRTNKQTEEDIAYEQKKIQDAKEARLKKPTAAKNRAYYLQEALRGLKRMH